MRDCGEIVIEADKGVEGSASKYRNIKKKWSAPNRNSQKSTFKNRFLRIALSFFLLFAIVSSLICLFLIQQPFMRFTSQMEKINGGKYHVLIGAPFVLKPGIDLEKVKFLAFLERSGFRRVEGKKVKKREFTLGPGMLHLAIDDPANYLRILLEKGRVVSILSGKNGIPLDQFVFPEQHISFFLNSIWEMRRPLEYEELPRELLHGVLATEDRKFYTHFGIDPSGIARAGIVNIQKGRVAQGGSTITQQLVKVLLQRRERDWWKKIEEIFIALAADYLYSKEEIITAYLNNVYLGQVGRFEIRGMAMAANLLLGKDLLTCTTSEYALLAGLIRSPNSSSPVRNPLAAASRTRTVMRQMESIDNYMFNRAEVIAPPRAMTTVDRVRAASYYFAALEKELESKRLMPGSLSPPLRITLGFDSFMQESIVESLEDHLNNLERKKGVKRGTLQGAVVVMDASNGNVIALAGGRDFQKSQFNRAISAKRQIGSLVKPFTYLIGLGATGFTSDITQATRVSDTRIRVDYDRISWKPKNYDGKFLGSLTVREALAKSRNIPAIRIGLKSGLEKVADLVRELGINANPDTRPSLLLGSCESTPLAISAAYSALANGGRKVYPTLVDQVATDTRVIWEKPEAESYLSSASSYVMTDILRTVFHSGSAISAQQFARGKNIAGKTGTTSKLRDAWFAGYGPGVVIVVWIGRDDNKSIGLTGASAALPLWCKYMGDYLAKDPDGDFPVPRTIRFVRVPTNLTGRSEVMAFIQGTEPNEKRVTLKKQADLKSLLTL